jgi:hypothetical protein
MDNWDQETVDLVEPGFIEFDEDGLGELGFIAVTGELDCRDADRDGRPGVEFSWQGSDEGDDVSGRGWAALNPDGTIEGHIYFHHGDDSAFRAEVQRSRPVSAPIELAMEEALRPGRYISEHASCSVISELESVAARIVEADPERAVGLSPGRPPGFQDHEDIRGSMHTGRRQRVAGGGQTSVT